MNSLAYLSVFISNCGIFLIYKLVFAWLHPSKKEYKHIKPLLPKIVLSSVEFTKPFCSLYGTNKPNLKYATVARVQIFTLFNQKRNTDALTSEARISKRTKTGNRFLSIISKRHQVRIIDYSWILVHWCFFYYCSFESLDILKFVSFILVCDEYQEFSVPTI